MNTPIDQITQRLAQLENVNTAMMLRVQTAEKRVETAEQEVLAARQGIADSQQRYSISEQRANRERRRLRLQAGLAFGVLIAAIFASPANRSAIAQTLKGPTLTSLDIRLSAVEAKTQFQSADNVAKSTTFSGCNVIVNNGGGSTDAVVTNAAGQGLGNLIVGYNNSDYFVMCTGSHNLIMGDYNNCSSYGGIVTGWENSISAPYASIPGGSCNYASGYCACVSGGVGNIASGYCASVSGGADNTASANFASVSGGEASNATGVGSSVSGGYWNTASGEYSSISGETGVTEHSYSGWSVGAFYD